MYKTWFFLILSLLVLSLMACTPSPPADSTGIWDQSTWNSSATWGP
ncbi:MAG: hypothetical protein N2318_04420 [Meiothermus sp.]|nr:hypothetical protein [Meiothermus sp.]